jgi:hypothetical protein
MDPTNAFRIQDSPLALPDPQPQIFQELSGLQHLRFHWRDKLPPYAAATSLASAMAHYPDNDLMLAMYNVPLVRAIMPRCVCCQLCCQ